jgi:hypothetical protein
MGVEDDLPTAGVEDDLLVLSSTAGVEDDLLVLSSTAGVNDLELSTAGVEDPPSRFFVGLSSIFNINLSRIVSA